MFVTVEGGGESERAQKSATPFPATAARQLLGGLGTIPTARVLVLPVGSAQS